MPLKKGKSKATRQANIEEMIEAGHEPKQAVAASYRQQRESVSKDEGKRRKDMDKKGKAKQKSLDRLRESGRV